MSDNTAQLALRQRPALFADTPLRACPAGSVRSLYIHIPFCTHKCHYCDFYSLVDSRQRFDAFTDRLCAELATLSRYAAPLQTLYIGGGTPTLLPNHCWHKVLDTLHRYFRFAPDVEFTVECNPETADARLFGLLAEAGVQRLSMGAQSFNPTHLATLQRVHTPESLPKAIRLARQAGLTRLSFDLIYAIPGQTLEDWRDDLRRAVDLGTDHISCYNLTYEPKTAMTARLERGLIVPTPEELEIEMFHLAASELGSAGFARYEVSNYARPGQECRHNLAYWRQHDWLAAGPSASAHVAGHRWKNIPHLDTYLSHSVQGLAPIVDHEPPDPARAIRESIMTGLRLREGLAAGPLLERVASACPQRAQDLSDAIDALRARGWLDPDRSVLRLTEIGILYADGAASELMLSLI
ncbi:MAG: radical SAM family heme chaperone HemW [Phycisphaerales bacterium]